MVRNLTPGGVGPGDTDAPRKWPKNPEDAVVNDMDTGALINELSKLAILPGKLDLTPDEQKACQKNPDSLIWTLHGKESPHRIQNGTYRGTQLALTKTYDLIEQRYLHRTFLLIYYSFFALRRWLICWTVICPSWMWPRSNL